MAVPVGHALFPCREAKRRAKRMTSQFYQKRVINSRVLFCRYKARRRSLSAYYGHNKSNSWRGAPADCRECPVPAQKTRAEPGGHGRAGGFPSNVCVAAGALRYEYLRGWIGAVGYRSGCRCPRVTGTHRDVETGRQECQAADHRSFSAVVPSSSPATMFGWFGAIAAGFSSFD